MAESQSTSNAEPALRRVGRDLDRRVPEKHTQLVEVTFLGANVAQDVPHTLSTENPEDIVYVVVRKDRTCDVYDDWSSASRRSWTKTYITLKSTVANAKVLLRLSSR